MAELVERERDDSRNDACAAGGAIVATSDDGVSVAGGASCDCKAFGDAVAAGNDVSVNSTAEAVSGD